MYEVLLSQMNGIESMFMQKTNRLQRDAHICEELHAVAGFSGCTFSSANQATY